jgi:osmotically-inducible protein OsmY
LQSKNLFAPVPNSWVIVPEKQTRVMTKDRTSDILRARLEKDRRINLHRYPIAISVKNEDLLLEGKVRDVAAKELSPVHAAGACGTRRIVDRLRVVPAVRMRDGEIRDLVCKALLEEPALKRCLIRGVLETPAETDRQNAPESEGGISVEVAAGMVRLNGHVPSLAHKRLTGVRAWWVPGTRDVVNRLDEVPPQEDNDNELTDAVSLVLEKDPFINATKLRAGAKDAVITLAGLVPTEAMKRMAERDAWYVLGVRNVVNRVQVKW